jgi:aryl-alcohol dehydrogenase-like predicted oxidoreductase
MAFHIALAAPATRAEYAGIYIAEALNLFSSARSASRWASDETVTASFLTSPDPLPLVFSGAAQLAVVPGGGEVPEGLLAVGALAPAAAGPAPPPLLLLLARADAERAPLAAALAGVAEGCTVASSYAYEEVLAMLEGTPLGGGGSSGGGGGGCGGGCGAALAPALALVPAPAGPRSTSELLPTQTMALHALGPAGLRAPRIGLGVMSAAFYGTGDAAADEAATLAAIDAAVELCAPAPVLLDTAWIYASPAGLHSEAIVGRAVKKHGRDAFIICTKFGSFLDGPPDSSTATIERQYAESVARLGTTPDLYYQHRPDPKRDVADVVGDLKRLVEGGRIRFIGLSECTADELRRAHAVHPVTAVQMEWSLAERGVEAPQGGGESLIVAAARLGVAVVCYSPLARGLLGGALATAADVAAPVDRRRNLPRFAAGAMEENVARAAALAGLAGRFSATPAQLALAWLLRQGANVFPIPGTKTRERVAENFGAVDLAEALAEADVRAIEGVSFQQAGGRYGAAGASSTWEARVTPATAQGEGGGMLG